MSDALGELITLRKKLDVPAIAEQPDVEEARRVLQRKIEQAMTRIIPKKLLTLEREHGFSESFHGALEAYEQFGLFDNGSDKEIGDNAPGIGDVMHALKDRPELLAKIEQGFTNLYPVPFGIATTSLGGPMSKALERYHAKGKLRSSDGKKLTLDVSMPAVCKSYEGADDRDGAIVYDPERFDSENHGGKTKKEILEASKFPGWQVLLTENRDIPRRRKGQTVGGRPQIEANSTGHEYLALLQDGKHANEQGLTPEAWQALFIVRLVESDGEVLDACKTGTCCYCTGAYSPSDGAVPHVYWRSGGQAGVSMRNPGYRYFDFGSRTVVRVL